MFSPAVRNALGPLRALFLFSSGVLAGVLFAPKMRELPVPAAQAAPPAARARPSATEKSGVRHGLAPREIAGRALASTVFLRGGAVYGAGVVLDPAGHVLTCDHVIDGLDHVDAYFDGDPTPIPIEVVARAKDVDLALLSLTNGLPAHRAPLAASSVADVAMGDEVFAMGAPRKMGFSMSHGIVSYVSRLFDGTSYVQTDLAANGGSSGGPVMNQRGELIGISSFIFHNSEGLTFAVPIDYAYEKFGTELGGTARDVRRFHEWLDGQSRAVPPKT
ncbi:MAG TPA: trypsin-like peptidase domain-containing protein [Polyangiaceae bacterium]|nr:trypsin-like peptidase domain-containing protein [Polyangiaceae bacterium]